MDCKDRIREMRTLTGMNRRQFCERMQIPYQTVTDWELGHRHAPEYVVNLMEYYIQKELLKEKKGKRS